MNDIVWKNNNQLGTENVGESANDIASGEHSPASSPVESDKIDLKRYKNM